MPLTRDQVLTREQRVHLAKLLRWSRSHGWQHDVYPNTWRSGDGLTHIRYDGEEQTLVVDHLLSQHDPLRCRVALIPIDSPERAPRILAALGHIPMTLGFPDAGLVPPSDLCEPEPPATGDDDTTWISCPPELVDVSEGTAASATGADSFDGPASFNEAGQTFADLVDGRVMPDQAAEALSGLARAGLIVSVAYYDETVADQAHADDPPPTLRIMSGEADRRDRVLPLLPLVPHIQHAGGER